MTEITLFRFENKAVRTATVNGEVVWIAKDVAEGLEYIWKGSASLKHIPEEWRGVTSVQTPSGNQEMAYLTEQGLFFFLGRSDKPKALPFQKWVAGEVIPSIRKTGSYSAAPAIDLNDPAFLRQALLGYTEKVIALEAEKAILEPKAQGFDRFANSIGRTNLREVGKALKIGSQRGIELLRETKWIFRAQNGKWHAYADKIDAGYVEVKYATYTNTAGEEISTQQVFVTPKGMARLSTRLQQH